MLASTISTFGLRKTINEVVDCLYCEYYQFVDYYFPILTKSAAPI